MVMLRKRKTEEYNPFYDSKSGIPSDERRTKRATANSISPEPLNVNNDTFVKQSYSIIHPDKAEYDQIEQQSLITTVQVDNPKPALISDSCGSFEDGPPLVKKLENSETDVSKNKPINVTSEALKFETPKKNNIPETQKAGDSSYVDDQEDSYYDLKPTPQVEKEMVNLQKYFPELGQKYELLNKIGEGTFSTVYLAKDLQELSKTNVGLPSWSSPPIKGKKTASQKSKGPTVYKVALKRIYVTSSPQRIYNELHLLHCLVGCPNIAPLIDALRHEDQVIAVLPFYRHSDFRDFYRDLPLSGIKVYMRELIQALSYVHDRNIIHRDIKPTNFLYNPFTRKGVLVDFGLAERETAPDHNSCPCIKDGLQPDEIAPVNAFPTKGFLKEDHRVGRRANRAGTRGFRAPEVLLKCPNQTCEVDMWSVGVMLLSLLARRFPFFNSTDDVEALSEITLLFGKERMKKCAALHGLGFESNLPTKSEYSRNLASAVYHCLFIDAKAGDTLAEDSPAWELLHAVDKKGKFSSTKMGRRYAHAFELLDRCLTLNYKNRITAEEALKLEFFKYVDDDQTDNIGDNDSEDEVILD